MEIIGLVVLIIVGLILLMAFAGIGAKPKSLFEKG